MQNRLSFIETASWGVFKYTIDKNSFENIALWLVALVIIKIDIAHQGEWGLDFGLSDKPSTRCTEWLQVRSSGEKTTPQWSPVYIS